MVDDPESDEPLVVPTDPPVPQVRGNDVAGAMLKEFKNVDIARAMLKEIRPIDVSGPLLRQIRALDVAGPLRRQIGLMGAKRMVVEALGPGFDGPSMRLKSFESTARELFDALDLDTAALGTEVLFTPSLDDTAFDAIKDEAPDVAQIIEQVASHAALPFWSRRAVRNALAWFLGTVVVVAYVGGAVLLPPWGAIVAALLSGSGVTAPAAFRWASGRDSDKPST